MDRISWVSTQLPFFAPDTSLLATTTEVVTEADTASVLAGVLLTLVIIYVASKIGGEISYRLGFPPVLGELVGGVIVGISGLHLLVFPGSGITAADSNLIKFLELTAGLNIQAAEATFKSIGEVTSVLSELGVIILLFEIGLESNLKSLIAAGFQATLVACVGVTVPFVCGTLLLMNVFHFEAVPAIFAGAALTATSIGITSKVLSEIGQLKSIEGQIIVGAAVIDDIIGIIILAIVASLAKTGEVDLINVGYLMIGSIVFLGGSILLGNLLNMRFSSIAGKLKTRGNILIPSFIFAGIMAYIGVAIHLEAILGSFAAGLILDETEEANELEEIIKPIADAIVPIFFVCVGAQTNLGVLNPAIPENREGLIIALALIAVAIVGKIVAGFVVFGYDKINRLGIGVGMIPRGEVGLVFAAIGASSGALSQSLQVAVVMMVIITTFLAPPLLRIIFGKVEPEEFEEYSA